MKSLGLEIIATHEKNVKIGGTIKETKIVHNVKKKL